MEEICDICHEKNGDPWIYGEFKMTKEIKCHFFCLVCLVILQP